MAPTPAKQNSSASDSSSKKQSQGRKEAEQEDGTHMRNLWVGNLSAETTDADLMSVFVKYGALDSVTTYASRNYAFLYFKNIEDARAAKDALHGHIICGSSIKIEFARPAKPGKHLWVGAISLSVTKEHLESEFLKFGRIEDFMFLRDRNTAVVNYCKLEDAVLALKSMNGKVLGGEKLCIDYLRSQPIKKESWSDFPEMRDGRSTNKRGLGPHDFSRSSHFGSKDQSLSQNYVGRRDGQPSNVLWIGYPPSVQIDEQMLHNAMILFGEIERIKSFPSRHYSFVEFRSVDEARRAKEGLQGRLFNDPRIQILYSSSEFMPGRDVPNFHPGIGASRPDIFFNEPPLRPGSLELFGHPHPMAPNSFPGQLGPNAIPNVFMRPFGVRGFEPVIPGAELNDLSSFLHNTNLENQIGANWRRQSPSASGLFPSPLHGMRPPPRSLSGMWDVIDESPFYREPKRLRMDGPPLTEDNPFPRRKMDSQGSGDTLGFSSQCDRSTHGSLGNLHGQIQQSPLGPSVSGIGRPSYAEHKGVPNNGHFWRGVIAKGGTPVCNARCVPIGKGVESPIPDVVNCSARTGLNMLTKHYAEASGFEIVFFLPDCEDDFASYTEFLRYLGIKNRAGVAKFDDGTTLFLVPPSDFLTKVLNISGPERLYGVVLKLPQELPNIVSQQPQLSVRPHYADGKQYPPQMDYNSAPRRDEQAVQLNSNIVLREGSPPLVGDSNALIEHPNDTHAVQTSVPNFAANQLASLPAGVSLTPELIATLAALIPTNAQSLASTALTPANVQSLASAALAPANVQSLAPAAAPDNAQSSTNASAKLASVPQPAAADRVTSQGWRQEQHLSGPNNFQNAREEQTNHSTQQMGNEFGDQGNFLPQYMTYGNASSGIVNSALTAFGGSQVQDPALNMQQMPPRPANGFVIDSHSGQYAVSQANQPHQYDASHIAQNYAMMNASDAFGAFQPIPPMQQNPPTAQVQSGNLFQPQMGAQITTENVTMEFPNHMQQLQSAVSASGQVSSEGETDKNQRYQSTLQFAASLLLQIQQQQQDANAQTVHGSGNQQ